MASTATPRLYNSYADEQIAPGTRFTAAHGKTYVWVKAGAVALVAGNSIQAPAELTNHDQLTPSAAAIDATEITLVLGATAVTANQYRGGTAVIDTTPSLGEEYIIDSHPAADASASLTLKLKRPIRVALTTSSRVTLTPSDFVGVIQQPVTTLTGAIVGCAVSVIAAGEYGWIGCNGTFGTLIAGTPGVGLGVGGPGSAAGALVVSSATIHAVAYMRVTGVDGKCLPARWVL